MRAGVAQPGGDAVVAVVVDAPQPALLALSVETHDEENDDGDGGDAHDDWDGKENHIVVLKLRMRAEVLLPVSLRM